MIITSRVFENLPFLDSFAFSKVFTFKRVFENLRFRGPPFLKTSVDGHIQTKVLENALVWTGP